MIKVEIKFADQDEIESMEFETFQEIKEYVAANDGVEWYFLPDPLDRWNDAQDDSSSLE